MKCLLISLCYSQLNLFSHYFGKEGRGRKCLLPRDDWTSLRCVAFAPWLQASEFGSLVSVSLSLSVHPPGSLTWVRRLPFQGSPLGAHPGSSEASVSAPPCGGSSTRPGDGCQPPLRRGDPPPFSLWHGPCEWFPQASHCPRPRHTTSHLTRPPDFPAALQASPFVDLQGPNDKVARAGSAASWQALGSYLTSMVFNSA